MISKYCIDLPACDIDLCLLNTILTRTDLQLEDHMTTSNGTWQLRRGPISDIESGKVWLGDTGFDYQPIQDFIHEHVGPMILDPWNNFHIYTTCRGLRPHKDKMRYFTINFPVNEIARLTETYFFSEEDPLVVDQVVKYQDHPIMMNIKKYRHEVKAFDSRRRNMLTVSIAEHHLPDVHPWIKQQFGY